MFGIQAENTLYERPGSDRINGLLPPAPVVIKDPDKSFLSLAERVGARLVGVLIGTAVAMVVMAILLQLILAIKNGAFMPFFDPEKVELLARESWGFTSAVLVMAGVPLVFGAINWPSNLARASSRITLRFFMGAERWSWRQSLRALAVYTVASPWNLIVPVLAIPGRLILGIFVMIFYLVVAVFVHPAHAIDATARLYDAATRMLVFMAGAVALTAAVTVSSI